MICFHLKNIYFNMVKSGEKTHEYREMSKYWALRLWKLKQGETMRIYNAYTSEYIKVKFIHLDLSCFWDLPEYVKKFFGKQFPDKLYFDVEFKKV